MASLYLQFKRLRRYICPQSISIASYSRFFEWLCSTHNPVMDWDDQYIQEREYPMMQEVQRRGMICSVCVYIVLLFCNPMANAQPELPVFSDPVRLTVSDTETVLSRNTHGNLMFGEDGALHLVYTERNVEGTGIGLPGMMLYQVLRDGEWSEPLAFRSETGDRLPLYSGGNPSLYPAPDGSVHLLWHDYRNSTSSLGTNNVDVFYRRLDANGTLGDEQQIAGYEGNQWRPKIRGVSNNQIAIGWYDFFQETGPDMLVTFSDENGTFNLDEPFAERWVQGANPDGSVASDPHLSLGVVTPDFAYDSQGRLHTIWTKGFTDADATLSYGVLASPPSKTLTNSFEVSPNGGAYGDPPKIYVDAEDQVWIVWTERVDGLNHNIYLAKKTPDASEFEVPIAITNYTSPNVVERADIAISPNGLVYVIWTDFRDTEGDLFLRVYDPAAEQLSGELRLTEEILTVDDQPSIKLSPSGEMVVVWQSERDGNTELYMLSTQIETSVMDWKRYE